MPDRTLADEMRSENERMYRRMLENSIRGKTLTMEEAMEVCRLASESVEREIGARALADLIASNRYSYSSETELQERIASVLVAAGVPFRREVILSPQDRPDFMVGSNVIEAKIASPRAAVLRQIHRYAQHPEVSAIVLVTRKARHLNMPATLNGKPIHVASLLEGSF